MYVLHIAISWLWYIDFTKKIELKISEEYNRPIGIMVRMFTNGTGERGSIPG